MPGAIIDALTPAPSVRGRRAARGLTALAVGLLLVCLVPVVALASSGMKSVTYRGYRLMVPRAWPVYDLAKDPGVCVRFNRHAVYLGHPGANQQCPAHAAGRTEAILLEPQQARAANVGTIGAGAASGTAGPTGQASGALVDRVHGVIVTATWSTDPALITRALGLRSLTALRATPVGRSSGPAAMSARVVARAANAAPTPGSIYTGLGFDVCSTPSSSQMSSWGSSSYHAIGVYIGGVNRACAQPNLSPAWVTRESGAGWHLIPIYVGLQAPSNSCGCAAISRSNASNQGRAAAMDAVTQQEALGMGPGNPVYFDMEAYSRGTTNSSAVLTFLAAWTTQLHAEGYKSGVYSSDYSGISDLVSEMGTGYTEPDEIWIANWNGIKSTSDSNVPSSYWANHQRLHQYDGGHNESHGGVTLNIDGDYLDASTAAAGSAASPAADPSASSPPTITGQALEGQTLSESHGTWSNSPTSYAYQWEDCDPAGINCFQIPGATSQTYTLGLSDVGHTIRVTETASNIGGTGPPAASQQTASVLSLVPLYWLFTSYGNVYPSPGTAWYGSPSAHGVRGKTVTGMAATSDGKGYWLTNAGGRVFAYGDAANYPPLRHGHPIRGILAAPGGGYWLYTAYGNIYPSCGTPWYGSPASQGFRGSTVTGIAATSDGKGYWLVNSAGRVFAYGDAATYPPLRHAHPIRGIATAPAGGYWLYTAYGNIYPSSGTAWYGSPSARGFRGSTVTGMAATPDGKGYWLTDSAGTPFAFGDAGSYWAPAHRHPIAGIAGG